MSSPHGFVREQKGEIDILVLFPARSDGQTSGVGPPGFPLGLEVLPDRQPRHQDSD